MQNKKIRSIIENGTARPMPHDIKPMLATLVNQPVEDDKDWYYEMKWDGFRALSYLNKGNVNICSRNNKSFNEKFYPLYNELKKWKINAVFDGEIVVLDKNGLPDFSGLQLWRSEADGQLVYYIFDILWYEGIDLMKLPIENRSAALAEIIPASNHFIRKSETLKGHGKEAFKLAEKLHLEGIIAKKAGSIYADGLRTKDWLKIKTEKRQEFIIGGYTRNEGSNKLFSALLLGIMEKGEFRFVTPVGTGFNKKMQEEIIAKAKPYITKKCPFIEVPEYNKPSRFRPNPPKAAVTWLKPALVAEISFRELTSNGAVRHPSFKGLREDKSPSEVVWETPSSSANILENTLVKQKIIKAGTDRGRLTLLNPKDEMQTRIIDGHELRFTNLSKVYWPEEKYTKRDMINYYYLVAPYMLPYLKNRPQTLNRYPHGIEGESFYQKDVTGKVPEWLKTFPYFSYRENKEKQFLVCTNEASLLYIASLGCIEINPWNSSISKPDHPDWCIIDLDPDRNTFNQVIEAARVTKKVLDAIEVPAFCKTSGSTGLHIYIPLGAKYTYEESKEFGRKIVKLVHNEIPDYTSIERKTSERNGKMYLDFLQNRPQATVAAPYSLRPKKHATVSMPLHWEEVKKGLKITDFTIRNVPDRLKEEGDIFKGVLGKGINMTKAVKKMNSLLDELVM
ncbi:MAG: DNA ligase D [Flavisolibacter sp.]